MALFNRKCAEKAQNACFVTHFIGTYQTFMSQGSYRPYAGKVIWFPSSISKICCLWTTYSTADHNWSIEMLLTYRSIFSFKSTNVIRRP